MPRLSVFLLGPLQVILDGEPATGFDSDKVRALLAYLAVETDAPHRREKLAGLLWPDQAERSARTNLRNVLANLRKVIGDRAANPPFLGVTRQTIRFEHSNETWVDVAAFTDLLQMSQAENQQAVYQLEEAIKLVRGGFLEGFSLAGCAAFEEWVLFEGERLQRQALGALDRLSDWYEKQGDLERALEYACRQVELEPWWESAQRQVMRLLATSGQRGAALAQYEACRQALVEELGIEPELETKQLYEQIRQGELSVSAGAIASAGDSETSSQLPEFLTQESEVIPPPVFVARERELAGLNAFLDEAVAGHGQVVLVTGGTGQGKTALLTEFARRAMGTHPGLLVAWGNCNAYSGVGDPYLPFRDIVAMLCGDVHARWHAGVVTTEHARRLWNAFPMVIQALVQHGPHITGTLISEQTLLSLADPWSVRAAAEPPSLSWLQSLRRQIARRQASPQGLEPSYLFQQVTHVLRDLAETHPLLLVLDDLQWADTASIGLLFHLGRRLAQAGSRILIAAAYRAEEVTGRPGGERPPLEKVLGEFKRTFGDIWLDLAEVEERERRCFVDALLETEPNCLGEDFRRVLVEHTGGHPLFTVELLRAMQARGDLVRDAAGRWTEGAVLDWNTLPARVEAVIEERVGRLTPGLREILAVASVEGADFAVEVVAAVQGLEERVVLRQVTEELERRHRLVTEQAEVQRGSRRIGRFKFGYVLAQKTLYQQLSQAERRLLHGEVAAALERYYAEQRDEFAVKLAHHYDRAGEDDRALYYFSQAAENASRVYANEEAYTHYTRAIEAAGRVPVEAESVIGFYLGRGLVCERLGDFEGALADYEEALQLADNTDEGAGEHLRWRALLGLGRLWASRDYSRAYDHFQRALELAQRMDAPPALADSLNWMGNWYLNAENPQVATRYHREALGIVETLQDPRSLASTLDLLGIASLLGGDLTACVGYYDRAIPLFREMADQPSLASSLTGRGNTVGSAYTNLALVSPAIPVRPRRDFEEAIRIAQEIGSPAGESWALWSLALLNIMQGQYGPALEAAQRGLDIANQIGHREWIVGCQTSLGRSYLALLASEEARRQLESALNQAQELQSRVWIHLAAGGLAAAHCLLEDWTQAKTCLEMVLSAGAAMDTIQKRYCWARRAELALGQGDPALALEIVQRLINSASGMATGRVITFLWKLKGEASAAMGHTEQACSLLHTARENAQTTGERFLLWRIHASLGRLYCSMGRPSHAEKEFSTAHELVQELADTVPSGELRDVFLQRAHERLRSSP